MVWWLVSGVTSSGFSSTTQKPYIYLQKCGLVNIKLKWVKDKVLDSAVSGQRDLKAACTFISIISNEFHGQVPIYHLRRFRGHLGLPHELRLSSFMRRYPTVFHESSLLDSAGTRVPTFGLTPEALIIRREELDIVNQNRKDLISRVCKLLMLVRDSTLPLQTIDQLKWDLGLPFDYHQSLIPHLRELFHFVKLEDGRVGLKLLVWDDTLAVSHLEKNVGGMNGESLAFPVSFTRGFGLKRKCMEWLEEWQKLPYTSPYTDCSHLDPRTDVSEKRIVGVFHELLHLTIHKQTERKNVSNLRKPLGLPQKFTKVFERHPGIFYISKKNDSQTVVVRDGYLGSELVEKHPLVEIRQRYAEMLEKGFLGRSMGLYRKANDSKVEEVQG